MLKWLTSSFVVISSLVAVAVLALWLRGLWRADVMGGTDTASWGFGFVSCCGVMEWQVAHDDLDPEVEGELRQGEFHWQVQEAKDFLWLQPVQWQSGAFAVNWRAESIFPNYARGRTWIWSVRLPNWFVALLFSAPAITWWALKRRRPKGIYCRGCGYDLRGSAPAAACPECGAARLSTPAASPSS